MENDGAQLLEAYGNRVRLRVSGICIENDKILLVGHKMPGHQEAFWAPPGGGIQFGETARVGLEREFLEETGLKVCVGEMLLLNEFIGPPLHAIEIFFKIEGYTGTLNKGTDPEFSDSDQIIQQVRFMRLDEIRALPYKASHRIFRDIDNLQDIFKLGNFI